MPKEGGRPSQVEETASLARLCMVQPVTSEERGSKHLAGGNPGAIGSRCDAGLLRGTYERCRGESTDQTTIIVITDEVLTFGVKSWSRGQKVRLLLLFAQVECRPSLAPPISMDILSTRQWLMAIRVNAHCLRG